MQQTRKQIKLSNAERFKLLRRARKNLIVLIKGEKKRLIRRQWLVEACRYTMIYEADIRDDIEAKARLIYEDFIFKA